MTTNPRVTRVGGVVRPDCRRTPPHATVRLARACTRHPAGLVLEFDTPLRP
ncbi:hypothetical protein [Streptomyces sp. NPDC101165]|uniref:hypothetical protein n=1 Tax=Streptomyces sp. NPDC101165 TaxID=3366119 RepID=UPI00381F62A1